MSLSKDIVATQQQRLVDLGFYTGPVDGIAGERTRFALLDFKAANGLRARPYPGPVTMQYLWQPGVALRRPAAQPRPDEPANVAEARRLLGVHEATGPANNPVIMDWAEELEQWYPGDDTPWCGLFVAHCNAVGFPGAQQTFNRLSARAWLDFGRPADADVPPLGATCVLWRTHRTQSWHGHVFLVTGHSGEAIRGIGGNQRDAVREDWFPRSRVLGLRVPAGTDLPPSPQAATGTYSTDEA
ncbi:Cell wall-associated hydrolases (invasion-associated proteins) [Rhodovulum sp. P5]|nr:TIGR02594 family protein [Rhodovulum sp. P5]ARE40894.1 Cell wall-associated hydrolases (invasion-associated proteins) [Rhodovulum sp. P5]